jgi:hypothetical protein
MFSRLDAVSLPEVPVTTALYCPTLADADAVNVMVALEVVGFGEIVAVTPLGSPETARVTPPENPFCPWT